MPDANLGNDINTLILLFPLEAIVLYACSDRLQHRSFAAHDHAQLPWRRISNGLAETVENVRHPEEIDCPDCGIRLKAEADSPPARKDSPGWHVQIVTEHGSIKTYWRKSVSVSTPRRALAMNEGVHSQNSKPGGEDGDHRESVSLFKISSA
jgi:hypothetical protein